MLIGFAANSITSWFRYYQLAKNHKNIVNSFHPVIFFQKLIEESARISNYPSLALFHRTQLRKVFHKHHLHVLDSRSAAHCTVTSEIPNRTSVVPASWLAAQEFVGRSSPSATSFRSVSSRSRRTAGGPGVASCQTGERCRGPAGPLSAAPSCDGD